VKRSTLIVAVGVTVLATGCGGSQSRQAAGPEAAAPWAACTIDSSAECAFEVSLNGADNLIVNNGATVVFTRNGDPVQAAALDVLCWSEGEDVEAGSCTNDGKVPPAAVDIKATTVAKDGKQWPALAIRVGLVKDSEGQEVVATPATALMGVTSDEGTLPITVEVTCCDRIP